MQYTEAAELHAWLGAADTEFTPEQFDHFTALVHAYERDIVPNRPGYGTDEYFREDWADETEAATVAAYEIAAGIFDLAARGRAYRDAKTAAYQGAVMAALDGASEVQAAQQAGITRPTLRKALGK